MGSKKSIIGMIHLSGLYEIKIQRALDEIKIYAEEGVDACLIENYHSDTKDVITVLDELKKNPIKIEVGINILPNEFEEAYRIANEYDCLFIQLDFIAGNYKGGRPFDINGFKVLRERYPHINILGGVWPKYYEPVEDTDEALRLALKEGMERCDAIVVTGSGTGQETPLQKVMKFRQIVGNFPLIVGAGLDETNIKTQMLIADGGIIGSAFKPSKSTNSMVDRTLVKTIINAIN